MSDSVVKRYKQDRNEKILSNIVYKLSIYANPGYNFNNYCIVEGATDQYFYSNINKDELCNNTIYLYNYKSNNDVGKDAVISSYFMINKNNNLKRLLQKCIFIVDHDYDGVRSMKYFVNSDIEKNITTTKLYSFENYFLTKENIKVIFKYLNLTDKDINNFEDCYERFIKEISEYVKLKSTTIELKKKNSLCYDENCKRYIPRYKYNDIFSFKFANGVCLFNKAYMYEEIIRMKKYISYIENANVYYGKYSHLVANNRNYIRGHDAFNFLTNYLKDIHSIELNDYPPSDLYISLVQKLNIDIDIKNGIGELL